MDATAGNFVGVLAMLVRALSQSLTMGPVLIEPQSGFRMSPIIQEVNRKR